MKIPFLTFFAIAILSAGCVTGPKDKRTFADSLSEKNYENSPLVVGVPGISAGPYVRKPVTRKISGKVFCGEGFSQYLANFAKVEVLTEDSSTEKSEAKNTSMKSVANTHAQQDGTYEVSVALDDSKNYYLSGSARCGSVTRVLSGDFTRDLPEQHLSLK